MKIYKSQKEVEKDIKDGVLAIEGDVSFECSISIDASITAWNITAWNITAWNITARDITAWNITAGDITAWNITAGDITAWNITAWDINARDINAGNISYHAFLCAYIGIKCKSFKARRDIHQDPICLDGKLEIIRDEKPESLIGQEAIVEVGGKKYTAKIIKEQ